MKEKNIKYYREMMSTLIEHTLLYGASTWLKENAEEAERFRCRVSDLCFMDGALFNYVGWPLHEQWHLVVPLPYPECLEDVEVPHWEIIDSNTMKFHYMADLSDETLREKIERDYAKYLQDKDKEDEYYHVKD